MLILFDLTTVKPGHTHPDVERIHVYIAAIPASPIDIAIPVHGHTVALRPVIEVYL